MDPQQDRKICTGTGFAGDGVGAIDAETEHTVTAWRSLVTLGLPHGAVLGGRLQQPFNLTHNQGINITRAVTGQHALLSVVLSLTLDTNAE